MRFHLALPIRLLALSLALPLFAGAGPAAAATTPWQDVAPGARLRLISSDIRSADGTTQVGLELDMPQGYRTYWRLPGETGIPTRLDLAGSLGVAEPVIEWPYPSQEIARGYLDYVYRGSTVLPVVLRVTGNAPVLRAAVTMGVCSQVCVPVRAEFALPLSFAAPDTAQDIRLRQAAALAPIAWNRARPAFAAVVYDATRRALRLSGVDPAVDPASVIASTGDPTVIFDAPQKSPDGAILLPLRARDGGTEWTASPVALTFLTTMGSFEVSRRVSPSPTP